MAASLLSHPVVWGTSIIEVVSMVSIVAILVTAATSAYRHWRSIECHHAGCHRVGRFPHGPYRLCHVHHPTVPSDGNVTARHIRRIA